MEKILFIVLYFVVCIQICVSQQRGPGPGSQASVGPSSPPARPGQQGTWTLQKLIELEQRMGQARNNLESISRYVGFQKHDLYPGTPPTAPPNSLPTTKDMPFNVINSRIQELERQTRFVVNNLERNANNNCPVTRKLKPSNILKSIFCNVSLSDHFISVVSRLLQ